jgi:hypothetical protein
MKLIAEYNEHNVECLVEKKEDGSKNYTIEGVFMQAEQKNRNGRIYPKKIMENAVAKYVEDQVSKNRAVGELNHPEGPTVNLDKVSHLITDLRWEGNDVVGKARILETPMGQIVRGLLEGGVNLGVSTRGMGSLEQRGGAMYVKDDFTLSTVDIVQDPSAPNAFVNGIMEGVEWVWSNGILTAQEICEDLEETEFVESPSIVKGQYAPQVREYKNFLSSLKKQNF